jgi:copper homeostasis protein (lipoprotein)
MRARWTILAVAALVLGGCGKPAGKVTDHAIPVTLAPASAVAPTAPAKPGEEPMVLRYAGDLPCADCPGIRTELTLTRKAKGWAEGRYSLSETYLERGGPHLTTGDWTTLRGDAADPDASVYQLDPDHPQTQRNFLRVGDDLELKALDKDMKRWGGTVPDTLKRVR